MQSVPSKDSFGYSFAKNDHASSFIPISTENGNIRAVDFEHASIDSYHVIATRRVAGPLKMVHCYSHRTDNDSLRVIHHILSCFPLNGTRRSRISLLIDIFKLTTWQQSVDKYV